MVVDGRVGFTGGMNIREGCLLELSPRHPVRDLHFRVEGPAVAHLQEVLADDWAFTTGELLQGRAVVPAPRIRPAKSWRGASPTARTRTSSGCA